MASQATAIPHGEPAEAATTQPSTSRVGCFDVFKKFGRSAWRKFGSSTREPRSTAPAPGPAEPPIQSLVVDEDVENMPGSVQPPHGSDVLEVDPNETSEVTFEGSTPFYLANASNRNRIYELCARYGIPFDAEALQPLPTADATEAQSRVPKRTRQRVRTSCHVCHSVFKGERVCQKCGHSKCGDCSRRPVTESVLVPEKAFVVSIDSSDDDKSITSMEEPDAMPGSVEGLDVERLEQDGSKPIVEKSKYMCHKCHGEFALVANSPCESCGHERCARCSRQVAHISHPYGEDGRTAGVPRQQRVYRPCKQRVRHFCDQCGEMFAPRSRVCNGCAHTRCKNCTRQPRKRRKTEADHAAEPGDARMTGVEAPAAPATETQDDMVS